MSTTRAGRYRRRYEPGCFLGFQKPRVVQLHGTASNSSLASKIQRLSLEKFATFAFNALLEPPDDRSGPGRHLPPRTRQSDIFGSARIRMTANMLRRALFTSVVAASAVRAQAMARPLSYVIRLPDPASKTFVVDVVVPSDGRDSVILIMPIWSPGMYTLQSYGDRVTAISAKAADGTTLDVSKPTPSRWVGTDAPDRHGVVHARRARNESLQRRHRHVPCDHRPATFSDPRRTVRSPRRRPARASANWKPAATSLDPATDGSQTTVAPNYDVLADSPILAGTHMSSAELTVGGVRHRWAYLGESEWERRRPRNG
jgi:hypothetical protein